MTDGMSRNSLIFFFFWLKQENWALFWSDVLHQNKHSFREEFVQKTLMNLVSTQLLQPSIQQNVKLKVGHAVSITELTTSLLLWSVRTDFDLRVHHSWGNMIQLSKFSDWALVSNLRAPSRVTPADLMKLLINFYLPFFRSSCLVVNK